MFVEVAEVAAPQREPPLLCTFPLAHILQVTFNSKDRHCLKEIGERGSGGERTFSLPVNWIQVFPSSYAGKALLHFHGEETFGHGGAEQMKPSEVPLLKMSN